MIIIKRLTPYWSAIIILTLFLVGIYYPTNWQWIIGLLFIVPVLEVLIMRQRHWRLDYLGLSLASIILLVSAYTFMLIQESSLLIYVIIGVTVILHFLFVKNLSVFLFQPAKYIAYSLEHISQYSNVVASFYLYVSIFIFQILGLGRLRYLLAAAMVGTAILVWQTFWIQKVTWKRGALYAFIITLVIVELIWVFHFLPASFFVSGFLLTIGLYLMLHLSRHYLAEALTKKQVVRYILTSLIAVVVLLVTAKWF
ncbi:MAG: hypothetical protein Q8P90_01475 [bacterium]|nr:hypothetical protein [bacterium]